jgi:phospholipase/carboxylesterase
MAFRLAFERPELFAGVMSVNGPLPRDQAPLRDWSKCREIPVFWAHDRNSDAFDQDQLCRQLRLLHIAGFSVTLRQYPCEDLLCSRALADANHWIMEMIASAITDRKDS